MEGYTKYANDKARKLGKWSLEENNRIKASKLKRIADKMEDKYRKTKEFKRNKNRVGECVFVPLIPLGPPQPKDKNPFKTGTTRSGN